MGRQAPDYTRQRVSSHKVLRIYAQKIKENGMKLKTLTKQFSYNDLLKTCKREGWKIPSSKDVEKQTLEHNEFWISDLPGEKDKATHARIYRNGLPDLCWTANKNFLLNAVVIVEEKFCKWHGNEEFNTYRTECDNSIHFIEGTPNDNSFKYCPYCGQIIQERKQHTQKLIDANTKRSEWIKMKTKLLYIDTETTGLYPNKHGLTQVAAIVVIDGEEVDRVNLSINPETYETFTPIIDDKALEIQGKTREDIALHHGSNFQFTQFVVEIGVHLAKDEKFQLVGYNTSFDIGFLKAWFKDNDAKFSDYFTYKDIDVFALVKHLRLLGGIQDCENDKLSTVCEYFGIELDAHDAMNDIVATRQLYKHISNEYVTINGKI